MITSVGAILLDAQGQGMKFFGLHLPDEVVAEWSSGGRRQLVFEAEVLPYLLALSCWSKILEKRHVLVFVDRWSSAQLDQRWCGISARHADDPQGDVA
jgi:hypothetical protein